MCLALFNSVHAQDVGSTEFSISSKYSGIWLKICSGRTYKTNIEELAKESLLKIIIKFGVKPFHRATKERASI